MSDSVYDSIPARLAAATRRRPSAVSIGADDIARAARELVDAYGFEAIALMQKRARAVLRRGDAESAKLWSALVQAIEVQLATSVRNRIGSAAD